MSWQIKAVALIVLAAAPALFWKFSSGVKEEPAVERGPASAPAAFSAPLEFRPEADTVYAYAFQRRIKISGLDNSIPPIDFKGELRLHVTETSGDGFTAIVTEEVSGQPASAVAVKIQATRKGDQLEIYSAKVSSDLDQQHLSVTKDLLSLLFFPLRQDTTGDYDAIFERLADEGDFIRVKKVKLTYRGSTPAKILSSAHYVKWRKDAGMPAEVAGKEKNALGAEEITSENAYQLKFSGLRKAPRPANIAALNTKETLAIRPTKISLKDHPEYASLNWGEIASRLSSVERLSSSEQLKLFGDLVRMLEMDPAKIGELVTLMKSVKALGAKSPLFQQAVGALATNGSPEAQAALVAIYQDPNVPVSGKGSVLSALTTTQAALDGPTREFLADTMANEPNKDLSFGAAFALGSGLEKAPDDNQARNSIQRILSAWEASGGTSLPERLALLDVMGNSGRLEFFPAVSGALASAREPELRARAAFSLRFMTSSSARQALASALNDRDVGVRGGAAYGIRAAAWNEVFRDPVNGCSLNEPDSQIRKICLEVHNRHSALAQQ